MMIHISDLRYTWPGAAATCLTIDHLDIAAGQRVFLHGPSGSGKSTLLGLLAGVLQAQSGEVSVAGVAWHNLSRLRRDEHRGNQIGYIFQQFNLLPYLSLLENVILPCRISAVRKRNADRNSGGAKQEAQNLLQQMGLSDDLWYRPAQGLSVGQQQRVAAARALIGSPSLIIADEPTSALDTAVRTTFMSLLLSYRMPASDQENEVPTVIFVSHDMSLAKDFDQCLSLPQLNQSVEGVPV